MGIATSFALALREKNAQIGFFNHKGWRGSVWPFGALPWHIPY